MSNIVKRPLLGLTFSKFTGAAACLPYAWRVADTIVAQVYWLDDNTAGAAMTLDRDWAARLAADWDRAEVLAAMTPHDEHLCECSSSLGNM